MSKTIIQLEIVGNATDVELKILKKNVAEFIKDRNLFLKILGQSFNKKPLKIRKKINF